MNFVQANFISAGRYREGQSNRLSHDHLNKGEVYTGMYRLAENYRSKEAVTTLVRFLGSTALNAGHGLHKWILELLDDDLQPQTDAVESLALDGNIMTLKRNVNFVVPDTLSVQRWAVPPTEAYLRPYEDGMHEIRWHIASEQKTTELALPSGATQ